MQPIEVTRINDDGIIFHYKDVLSIHKGLSDVIEMFRLCDGKIVYDSFDIKENQSIVIKIMEEHKE